MHLFSVAAPPQHQASIEADTVQRIPLQLQRPVWKKHYKYKPEVKNILLPLHKSSLTPIPQNLPVHERPTVGEETLDFNLQSQE